MPGKAYAVTTGAGLVAQVIALADKLGLDYQAVDSCILLFKRSRLPCNGHVPTALDAFAHEHFLPASAGANWGWTRDLSQKAGRGVRECVFPAFEASYIEGVEYLEADDA